MGVCGDHYNTDQITGSWALRHGHLGHGHLGHGQISPRLSCAVQLSFHDRYTTSFARVCPLRGHAIYVVNHPGSVQYVTICRMTSYGIASYGIASYGITSYGITSYGRERPSYEDPLVGDPLVGDPPVGDPPVG